MRPQTSILPIAAPAGPYLWFRRLEHRDDLLAHFRARHDEYLRCGFRSAPDPTGLDIDVYDLYADHIGVYEYDPQQPRMVGGIRVVWPQPRSATAPTVEELLHEVDPQRVEGLRHRKALLPSEAAFDLSAMLDPVRARGIAPVEFSRTFTVPGTRGRGVGSFLVQAVFALARSKGAEVGIGTCPADRAGFYERAGCKVVREVGTFMHPTHGVPSNALLVDLLDLNAEARRFVSSLGVLLAPQGHFIGGPAARRERPAIAS